MSTIGKIYTVRTRVARDGVQSLPGWAAKWVYWNTGLANTPVRRLVPRVRAIRMRRMQAQILREQERAYRAAREYVSTRPDDPLHQATGKILDWMSVQETLSFKQHPWDQGSLRERDRLALVAELSLQRYKGNLLEIGAFLGETTVRLAALADQYGRRMVVVDPWQPGTQNCEGPEFDIFLQNTRDYRHVIDIVRASSLEPQTIQEIGRMDLAFSYVDGLHTYEATLSDVLAVGATRGMIAVDDVRWHEGTKRGYLEGAARLKRHAMFHAACREGYLLTAGS
jgi:hypothetical protein